MRLFLLVVFLSGNLMTICAQPLGRHHLKFDSLTTRWDEGIPLGNGTLGALIWKRENKLRISIDRVDLWDDRPMPEIDQLKFKWVAQKVRLNQYDSVQRMGDEPYEKYPAPTKLPGAAIEFDLTPLGKVVSNELFIENGLSVIKFENGTTFNNYIDATATVGYFGFEHLTQMAEPDLIIPNYHSGSAGNMGNSVAGQSLERLGYSQGVITRQSHRIRYHQPTGKNSYYEVLIQWFVLPDHNLIGQWTISHNHAAILERPDFGKKEPTHWPAHARWWKDYWSRSSIHIPDSSLERQYYLDMYKFGCVARSTTPPISLQAIWTADNGNLPPWKGDFHHDLNTQLSYWPGYASNHLDLTAGYTNWLWSIRNENNNWTKQYFQTDGLNVPGVTTITGKPMGGWIQYSMSSTTSAWLAQHFYWQWKYGMDQQFYVSRCKPYIEDVSKFIHHIIDLSIFPQGNIISSSPEYHDNNITAWFNHFTNYDLSLIKHQLLMEQLVHSNQNNSGHVMQRSAEEKGLPQFSINETGLMVAPGQNLVESHRHHSPYMAIYPLGLLDADDPGDLELIKKSLAWMEHNGTRNWTGYSFSWAACLYARAKDGDHALSMLEKFASNFCSINSFHLNGDQKNGQYSDYTYRPFTLEGNFAFAQGIHELLLQSHHGYIDVFPSIPPSWKEVSFNTLRTEGAFLVSAKKENNVPINVIIKSTAGGQLKIKLPFRTWMVKGIDRKRIKVKEQYIEMPTFKGQSIIFINAFE
jgi:alpha-L-fucosidase 2